MWTMKLQNCAASTKAFVYCMKCAVGSMCHDPNDDVHTDHSVSEQAAPTLQGTFSKFPTKSENRVTDTLSRLSDPKHKISYGASLLSLMSYQGANQALTVPETSGDVSIETDP